MKLSDYVMEFLAQQGIDRVFFVSGGGAMHLNDSLGKNKSLEGVCMLHEQGAAIAAEAYARVRDGMGACLVTSGPGATNAITGLVGAYIDSIPVIFISGQAKRADLRGDSGVRQFGIQEVDIVSMIHPYAKYAVQIQDASAIRLELEKATAIASHGRPGPVWIDIPLDIQASRIEPEALPTYEESLVEPEIATEDIDKAIEHLNLAEKPVMVLGHGIRLSHSIEAARELYNLLGVPVLTSWNGVDLIEDEHGLYYGRPGGVGQRAANFILQRADFVLTLGTRLNLLSTGYNFSGFLANAYHVMVDIDRAELDKKSLHPQLKIHGNVATFMKKLLARKDELDISPRKNWLSWCDEVREKYPDFIPEQAPGEGYVSNYHLIDVISGAMKPDDIYQFTSSGTTVDIAMKTFKIKWGQRAFLTKGLAAMGYDVPACVGSCLGSGMRRTVCVTGDGSACMNMQELEVIHRYNLPVKLFISDNSGYSMIYQSQSNNFHELSGCDKESGLTLPDFGKIAGAFGIPVYYIDSEADMEEKIAKILAAPGPAVAVVKTDIQQRIVPKQSSYMQKNGQMASRPLEDMAPLLPRKEIREIMGKDYAE